MLILTRRPSQVLYIGDGPGRIAITIVGVKGSVVRVGIEAPREVPVHRREIYERIKEEEAEGEDPPLAAVDGNR